MEANQDVDSLKDQEIMPGLRNIVGMVRNNHCEYNLRDNDGDASSGGNPGIGIDEAASIALSPSEEASSKDISGGDLPRSDMTLAVPVRKSSGICDVELTPFFAELFSRSYWPPAVGYTEASSPIVSALHPTIVKHTTIPYMRVTEPPWAMVKARVAATPSQLLQMFQPTATMSRPEMSRSVCWLSPRLDSSNVRQSPSPWVSTVGKRSC